MSWLLFAFLGPIAWAVSTHIDKYLVEKYFKNSSTAVLMVFTAIIGLVMLPFIWWFDPSVVKLSLRPIVVMMASGALYMGAMLLYLQALQREEASVVAPLFQAAPLWIFLLAYLFLDETLSTFQLIGAGLIIAGAAALSLDGSMRLRGTSPRFVVLMLVCTFVIALSSVIFKFFAVHDEFWSTTFWTYAGEAVFGFFILTVPANFKQFATLLRTKTQALLAINGANEIINLGAGLSVRFAYLLAPLAVVQAVSSTTTLFVFLFGILLTLFFPKFGKEDLSRRNLIQKGLAAVVIAAGVFMINWQ